MAAANGYMMSSCSGRSMGNLIVSFQDDDSRRPTGLGGLASFIIAVTFTQSILRISPQLSHALFCLERPDTPTRVIQLSDTVLSINTSRARAQWYHDIHPDDRGLMLSNVNPYIRGNRASYSLVLVFSTIVASIAAKQALIARYPQGHARFWY
jgi:hypothetical protein